MGGSSGCGALGGLKAAVGMAVVSEALRWREARGSGSCLGDGKWMIAFASCFDLYLRDEALKSGIPSVCMKWPSVGPLSRPFA